MAGPVLQPAEFRLRPSFSGTCGRGGTTTSDVTETVPNVAFLPWTRAAGRPVAGLGSESAGGVSVMSGMGGGLDSNNPTVVSAFHNALLHQGLIAVGILFVVMVVWNVTRAWQLRQAQVVPARPRLGFRWWRRSRPPGAFADLVRVDMGLRRRIARAGVDAAGDDPQCGDRGGVFFTGLGSAPGQRGG